MLHNRAETACGEKVGFFTICTFNNTKNIITKCIVAEGADAKKTVKEYNFERIVFISESFIAAIHSLSYYSTVETLLAETLLTEIRF